MGDKARKLIDALNEDRPGKVVHGALQAALHAQENSVTTANERQIGGNHYKTEHGLEHWDIVAMFGLDYFQGQITKYVMRWKKKGGIKDLEKAAHFLQKYIEIEKENTDKVESIDEWKKKVLDSIEEEARRKSVGNPEETKK